MSEGSPGDGSLSSSAPRRLPFLSIPLTVLDVDTCLLCDSRVELPGTKLPLFGSSKTTEVRLRLTLQLASREAESEMEPPQSLSTELTDRLDSVLCRLLF